MYALLFSWSSKVNTIILLNYSFVHNTQAWEWSQSRKAGGLQVPSGVKGQRPCRGSRGGFAPRLKMDFSFFWGPWNASPGPFLLLIFLIILCQNSVFTVPKWLLPGLQVNVRWWYDDFLNARPNHGKISWMQIKCDAICIYFCWLVILVLKQQTKKHLKYWNI